MRTKEIPTKVKETKEEFEKIEVLGRKAFFTNRRMTSSEVPTGMYLSHLRKSDDDSRFAAIEPSVFVNHGGSVLTKEPFDFGKKGSIALDEETDPNFTGKTVTLIIKEKRV